MPKRQDVCFVVAPIGPIRSEERDRSDKVLKYIITPAARECGYITIRADQISSPGIITSQIIQHLRDDPLVIADLTGRNPNVFYELAIRHIVGKPILQIIQVGETIPFDVSQIRTIEFDHHDLESAERCREELKKQIRAIQNDPANFGTILDYSKEGIQAGGEGARPGRPVERRKMNEGELELYVGALSDPDSQAKQEALKQLSGLVFTTTVERDANLLPKLVTLVEDSDVMVRRAALHLFERLNWRIMPSYKARYNKELLPLVAELALNDSDMEVKKIALEGLVASGDSIAVEVLVKLLTGLTEEQYRGVILDHIWNSIVDVGLGPKLRQELFREYEKSDSIVRARISRETANRYLG